MEEGLGKMRRVGWVPREVSVGGSVVQLDLTAKEQPPVPLPEPEPPAPIPPEPDPQPPVPIPPTHLPRGRAILYPCAQP